jgi:hypothetical protein
MLEHGGADARQYLPQLERATVLPYRCPCGCASMNFSIGGQPKPSGPLHPLADFVFGEGAELSGLSVFEQAGVLAGLEVYGMAGDAPKTLPSPEALHPFSDRNDDVPPELPQTIQG